MRLKFVILALFVIIIIIGGYFYFIKPNIYVTPPLTTPTKAPPSLNFYGKLIDYSQSDSLTIFKIQSEIVNWELNNTYLEIESKPELLYNFTYDYLRCIEQKWFPTEQECKNHFYQENNLSAKCRGITEISEKGLFYVKCDVKFELIEGNNYVFYFMKLFENEMYWNRVTISENLTEYKQNGAVYHENDLAIDQMTTTEGGEGELEPGQQRAVRIIPTTINTGELTELKILLINKQNNDIKYKIKDAKIVNEEASQWYGSWWQLPPYEERLENAIIDECSVSFDSSEYTISADSTKTLTFTVNCPEDIDITKTYEICNNYEERRNCRIETANRTDNLMLWGEIEFTDELGNIHIFPEKGIFKQSLGIK